MKSKILLAVVSGVAILAYDCSSPTTPATVGSITLITVTGATFFSAVGQTTQLTATATLSNGMTSDVSAMATWQSSSPGVATVSPTGRVTAQGFGGAEITATYQGSAGKASVSVIPPPSP